MVQRYRFDDDDWFADGLPAVAGGGRPEEPWADDAPAPLREPGSVKFELWNSRSSCRSVWPRSPWVDAVLVFESLCRYDGYSKKAFELGSQAAQTLCYFKELALGYRRKTYLVVNVYDGIVARIRHLLLLFPPLALNGEISFGCPGYRRVVRGRSLVVYSTR